jgi:hypothetical protein
MPRLTYSTETVAAILASPETYGFRWTGGDLNKDGLPMGRCPWIQATDTHKLEDSFGSEFVLAAINDTALRVIHQGIGRDMRWSDRKVSEDTIKARIVEHMLGKKAARKVTVVERRIYVANDGTEFADKSEMLAYNGLLAQDSPTA